MKKLFALATVLFMNVAAQAQDNKVCILEQTTRNYNLTYILRVDAVNITTLTFERSPRATEKEEAYKDIKTQADRLRNVGVCAITIDNIKEEK